MAPACIAMRYCQSPPALQRQIQAILAKWLERTAVAASGRWPAAAAAEGTGGAARSRNATAAAATAKHSRHGDQPCTSGHYYRL